MTDEQVHNLLCAIRNVAETLNGEGYHTALHAPTQAALDVRFLLAHFDRAGTCEDGLLPCPFCGGKAQYRTTPAGGHFVDCNGCQASSKLVFPDKTTAKLLVTDAWNSRNSELAEMGAKWKLNSSLEEWFPLSAERIENLERKMAELSKHWKERAAEYRQRAREWVPGDPMHESRLAVADMLENCSNEITATAQ